MVSLVPTASLDNVGSRLCPVWRGHSCPRFVPSLRDSVHFSLLYPALKRWALSRRPSGAVCSKYNDLLEPVASFLQSVVPYCSTRLHISRILEGQICHEIGVVHDVGFGRALHKIAFPRVGGDDVTNCVRNTAFQ